MSEEERMAYAEHLIRLHAKEVEYMSVFEVYEAYTGGAGEISDDDADAVSSLVATAKVEVSW